MPFSVFALLELLLPVSVHDFAVRAVLVLGCGAVFFDPFREYFPALPPAGALLAALGVGCIAAVAYGAVSACVADRLPAPRPEADSGDPPADSPTDGSVRR